MQIRIIKTIFLFLLTGIIIFSCNKRVNNDIEPADRISIPAFGTDATFEIATWNIEQFPKHTLTVSNVVEIIKDLDIDLFAVQEITNVNAFQNVINSLDDYEGVVATNTTNFALWTGIIYKSSMISISNQQVLFEDDSYNFPRLPYSVYIQADHNNKTFDFTLIVLHLKAFGDPASVQRRRVAIQKLEQYVSDKLQQGGDPDYIIAGDWNDQLNATDTTQQNVFYPFLDAPQRYVFLTLPFDGSATEYSYIAGNFDSLIDHILITASIDTTYNIETQILKIDQHFSQYLPEVSDHRPVGARMSAF